MKDLNFILARIDAEAALVEPGALERLKVALAAIATSGAVDPGMYYGVDSQPVVSEGYRVDSNGIATIPIHGYLAHREDWHIPGFFTGYDYIRNAVKSATSDASVRGVVFDVNSGGGEVAGAFELADQIAELSKTKPTVAIVDNSAYSAAYLLSAATNQIVVAQSGGVGSIGVVTMHLDVSKAAAERGYKVTMLYAGDYKVDGNPYEPLSDGARSRIEARLQQLYNLFVDSVASNRSMNPEAVRGTQAGLFQGQAAVDAGLADAVMAPSQAYAAFTRNLSTNGGGRIMTGVDKQNVEAVVPAANREELASARVEGASMERARIQSIIASEQATGREELAAHLAFSTDMSAEAAVAMLSKAPVAAKQQAAASGETALDRAMAVTGGGAGVGAGDQTASVTEQDQAADLMSAWTKITGRGSN